MSRSPSSSCEHGADVNRREQFRDQSAVMWAAAESHADMVAFLVSKGADLSIRARANDWDDADQQRAARAVSSDRRPDAAALRRAGGMPRLREGDASMPAPTWTGRIRTA